MVTHLLRQKNFLFIWAARQTSALGDWILLIVLPLYIHNLTGSTIATGTMFITQMTPRLFFGSIAGTIVERLNKKWTLVFTDLIRGIILCGLFVIPADHLWVFFLIVFIQNMIGTVFMPAHRSLMVDIVEREHIVDANSITIVSDNIIRLVGPSLGGALLGIGGLHISIAIDILSYIISSILISLITLSVVKQAESKEKSTLMVKWLKFWNDWWKGIKIVRKNQLFLVIFWMSSITWLAQGMINVLFVPYVLDVMGESSVEFGWIESAEGVGGLIGGYLLLKLNKKVNPFPLIMISLLLTGIMFLFMFNLPYLLIVLILNVLLGVPNIIFSVRLETLLQEHVPEDYLSRVFGSYNTMIALATLAGMALATIFNFIGTVLLLNLTAVLFIAVGILLYRPLRHKLREQGNSN